MHGWCSCRLRVEPIFVRFEDEVGFCFVLEELMIFDRVVADLSPTPRLWRPSVLGRFETVEAKSANIELCVICRSSLKSKI